MAPKMAVIVATLSGFVLVACTFPSVEYESGSSSSSSSTSTSTSSSCAVPVTCENNVAACRKQAEAQQTMCLSKCTMACTACDSDYDQAIELCVARCEKCSMMNDCANATEGCKALLGVP